MLQQTECSCPTITSDQQSCFSEPLSTKTLHLCSWLQFKLANNGEKPITGNLMATFIRRNIELPAEVNTAKTAQAFFDSEVKQSDLSARPWYQHKATDKQIARIKVLDPNVSKK